MKRRSEHLVRKRDGRTEFLRATKLARSIHLALKSVGVDEDWRAIEVSSAVLAGLRVPRGAAGGAAVAETATAAGVLTTAALSAAVESVLVAIGHPAAAVAYSAVATERSRRRSSLATLGRSIGVEGPADVAGGLSGLPGTQSPASVRRLPKE